MTRTVEADYVVVGAGATGMAFTDALIDHADVRVALVDRRHGVGGHWLEDYSFVRLHQSSTFYGVASTVLGGHRQTEGPEAGLHERADQSSICAYYDGVLTNRLLDSGRVDFYAGCDYLGDRTFVSLVSGERYELPEHCRVVDAHYLSPDIPAATPPRFGIGDGARVIPVNDLVGREDTPSQYVVVGSGKTATDAIIWLLGHGTDPDAICWVRPREPWMLNRALIQPDPVIYLGMVADMMRAASSAPSLPRPVPRPRGRRHHAAHRPLGRADDGEVTHPRDVGARPAAHRRERRTPGAHRHGPIADGSTSPRARSASRTTRSS